MSDTEDYEALRQKNIVKRNAILTDLFNEIKNDINEINKLEKSKLNLADNYEKETSKSVRRKHKSPTVIYREYNFRNRARPVTYRENNFSNRARQYERNTALEILFKELKVDTDNISKDKVSEKEKKEKSNCKSLRRKPKPSTKPLKIEIYREYQLRPRQAQVENENCNKSDDNDNDYKSNVYTSNNKATSEIGKKRSDDDEEEDEDDEDEDDEDWLP